MACVNSVDRRPTTEQLLEVEDPRQLIVTWLIEAAGLGAAPRGAGR